MLAASSAGARSAPRAQRRRLGTPFARYGAGARAWASRVVQRRSCRGRAFPPRTCPCPSGRCLFLLTAPWLGRRATARCGAGPLGTCEADAVRDCPTPRPRREPRRHHARRASDLRAAAAASAVALKHRSRWRGASVPRTAGALLSREMRRRAERARRSATARARSLDRSEGDPVYFSAWSRVGGPDATGDALGLLKWQLIV